MQPQVLSAPGRPRLMHDVVPPYASTLAKTLSSQPAPVQPANVAPVEAAVQASTQEPAATAQVAETAPVEPMVQSSVEPMPVEASAHPAFVQAPAAEATQEVPAQTAEEHMQPAYQTAVAKPSKSHVVAIIIALLVSAALLATAYYAFSQRGSL